MTRTPASLLERLRVAPDDRVWERFVDLYGPLIYQWGRGRFQLAEQDAEDVTQDVLITVVREMPDFHYDPNVSFRAWRNGDGGEVRRHVVPGTGNRSRIAPEPGWVHHAGERRAAGGGDRSAFTDWLGASAYH